MPEFYYSEPRLNLSASGETVVHIVAAVSYIVAAAGTIGLLLSGNQSAAWLSMLLALFLGDRLLHRGEAEKAITELHGERVNLAPAVTPAAYRLLARAFRKSLFLRLNFNLMLMHELLGFPDVREALRRLDVPTTDFLKRVDSYLESFRPDAAALTRRAALASLEALIVAARDKTVILNERFIGPRSVFAALVAVSDPAITKLLELFDLRVDDVQEAIVFGRWKASVLRMRRMPAVLGGFAHRPLFMRHRVMNRAWTARPTLALDRYSTDLTALARAEQVGFLIGHGQEMEHLLNIVSRPGKPNALLVGEPGVGKSTIIAHLAFRMIKDQVPPVLFDKRLVSLDVPALMADAAPEVLSGRIQQVIGEVLAAGNIVLVIPSIHDLFRTSQAHGINAIDALLPVIKNEAIPLIGETYPREFKRLITPRTDFLEQFEVVKVEEISDAEAVRFLVYSGLILEREYRVLVTFRALRKAVEIARRYFKGKPLPGSALDLVKQALAKASQDRLKSLDERVVIAVAERQSKIPIHTAGAAEAKQLLNLESIIHERLVNQEAAVSAVSRALREYRSGLARKGGPIATFLFVGPTGVGKTELAKTLTAIQFGSKDLMHRFDMSEYQDRQSTFRFIGTPDGEKTGALTDAILENPYSLVLLDEFEKAHPDILNLFLQVFDDGRLTDSLGRTASFENAIIIATSNAHSEFIKAEVERGRTMEEIGEELRRKLTDYFKPELINRFSDVIVFRNLTRREIETIAGFLVGEVATVLQEAQGVGLTADAAAIAKLAELGYSPVFGARPLRQVVSEKVRSPLAEKILRKEIARGNRLILTVTGGRFEYKVVQ